MNLRRTTRREFAAGVTACVSGFGLAGSALASHGDGTQKPSDTDEISRTAEAIHQEVVFKADRRRVYATLTDEKLFERVVQASEAKRSGMMKEGKPATISREAGGAFSMFGGIISGRHIEFVPDERIVQAWRAIDWKPGVYSIASFRLVEHESGCKLVFDHAGFPRGAGESLAAGWKTNYWKPMESVLS